MTPEQFQQNDIAKLMTAGDGKLNPFTQFAIDVKPNTNHKNRAWQQTEYQTAVNCAENASTYQRLMKKRTIFPYWQYKTAGDEKVREEHAALDGVTLRYDDEYWDSIYPPNGWKCRCYVVPKMEDDVNVDETEQHQRVEAYQQTPDWN